MSVADAVVVVVVAVVVEVAVAVAVGAVAAAVFISALADVTNAFVVVPVVAASFVGGGLCPVVTCDYDSSSSNSESNASN